MKKTLRTALVAMFILFIAALAGISAMADDVEVTTAANNADFGRLLSDMISRQPSDISYAASDGAGYSLARLIIKTDGTTPDIAAFEPTDVIAGPDSIFIAQFADSESARKCHDFLVDEAYVKYAEADSVIYAEGDSSSAAADHLSWGAAKMNADTAIDYIKSAYPNRSATVAVLDSGVSAHSFLGSRLKDSTWDYVDNDNDPSDENGHGTHVAGTIVDMTQGLKVYVKPYRILNAAGRGYTSVGATAVRQAANDGADVINLSVGGNYAGGTSYYYEAVNYAISKGVTVCIAAGNDSVNTSGVQPAFITTPGAIVVAAVDSSYARAGFSNYGTSVDLAAPGVGIYSTYYTGGYTYMNGTSMATPHISACAAMVNIVYGYSPSESEKFLKRICDDVGANGRDDYTGYGVPDLSKIINCKVTVTPESLNLILGQTSVLSGSVTPATQQSITWSSSNKNVATVASDGTVTAVGTGSATITAACYGATDTCKVTVSAVAPVVLSIDGDDRIYMGDSAQYAAVVQPDNASQAVTWSVSDSTVASVTSAGIVTGKKAGTVTLRAVSAVDSSVTDEKTITIVSTAVNGISISQTTAAMYTGETISLTATIRPDYATNKAMLWYTDNSAVATVDGSGNVTAVRAGTAHITVKPAENSGIKAVCTVTVTGSTADVTSVSVSPDAITMAIGDNASLTAMVLPANAANKSVTWESSNYSVVVADNNGNVSAVAAGSAVVTATSVDNPAAKASCTITVKTTVQGVTSIRVAPTSKSLVVGDTAALTATVLPSNAADKRVVWSSSNTSVATVDASGRVTAAGKGSAVVTATSVSNASVSAGCTITVREPDKLVTSLRIVPNALNLVEGESFPLSIVLLPYDAANRTVTWSSQDTSVATVSSSGIVMALKPGSTRIVCTANDGSNVSASIPLTIKSSDLRPVTKIKLNKKTLKMDKGDKYKLTVTLTPKNPTHDELTWESSDPTIATVNQKGKITALKGGKVTITATAYSGVQAKCTVTVKGTLVKSIALDKKSAEISIKQGESLGKTLQLNAKVKPSGADVKTLKWKSSDKKVATVDENGLVTSVGYGKCTITAKATDGSGKTAKCVVTVAKKKVKSVSISGKKKMDKGTTQQLAVTVKPARAYNKNVKWKSSNPKIATVDENGVVTALKKGKVTITATAKDGTKKKDTFVIQVVKP